MFTDEQIRALKERSEKHGNLWMRDGIGGCQRVCGVRLEWAESIEDPTNTQPGVLLGNNRVVPLRNANITDFVTLKPWDGSPAPTETDNLSLLQDAARSGLDVNFMTGDVRLPPGAILPPSSAS